MITKLPLGWLIAVFLCCSCMNGLADNLENFYFDLPEGKTVFKLNTNHLLVRFENNCSLSEKNDLLQTVLTKEQFVPVNTRDHFEDRAYTIVRLQKNIPAKELHLLLEKLNEQNNIRYATPFLEYTKDGVLQGITDRLIVQLKDNHVNNNIAGKNKLTSLAFQYSLQIIPKPEWGQGIYVVQFSQPTLYSVLELARAFTESGQFTYAEPDFLRLLKPFSKDPFYSKQWSLDNTGSNEQYGGVPGADMDISCAWNTTKGSPDVKVAIIDEGVDLIHPDLVNNLLAGYDAVFNNSGTIINTAGGPQANSNDAHGTACAGIVAAEGDNNRGIAGVAPLSKIIPVRIAYTDQGYWVASSTWIADGINWAWSVAGADVLSNSWGGGSSSGLINKAIERASTEGRGGLGAAVFFAAGNSNGDVVYPASKNESLAVAASSMCDERKNPNSCDGETWWGSNYGTGIDIAAPGVKIVTTDISGPYGYRTNDYVATFNGTSSACPNAAGVMALVYSAAPELSLKEARQIIETSCDKVGEYIYSNEVSGQPNGDWSQQLGYGRINACAALAGLAPEPPLATCEDGIQNGNETGIDCGGTNCPPCEEVNPNPDPNPDPNPNPDPDPDPEPDPNPNPTPDCKAPTGLNASGIAAYSATLNWTAVSQATMYRLRYRAVEGGNWIYKNTTQTYYNTGGLMPFTLYEFEVSSNCGDGTMSDYSKKAFFLRWLTDACPPALELQTKNITDKSVGLIWEKPEDSEEVLDFVIRLREKGTTDWQYKTSALNQYAFYNLKSATLYEWQVQSLCANGKSAFSLLDSFQTLSNDAGPIDYCDAYAESTHYEWIEMVALGDMINYSGNDEGYGNYTHLQADLSPGSSETLYLQAGFNKHVYTEFWTVWIDYNQDGDFKDENEMVAMGNAKSNAVLYSPIHIPAGTLPGKTRMRVAMQYKQKVTDACTVFKEGEVEDYSINISKDTGFNRATSMLGKDAQLLSESSDLIRLYPNPCSEVLYIDGAYFGEETIVSVYNIKGQQLFQSTFTPTSSSIEEKISLPVNQLSEGIYILQIQHERGVENGKFVVKH